MKGRNTTHLERWREMHEDLPADIREAVELGHFQIKRDREAQKAERAARRERIRYGETERERENRELSFCSNWQVEEYAA
jgi:hypothetical protein